MKTMDIVRRAGRNLRRAKMRTLLTSVAIAVGGFAIMVSLMAGEGARQYVDRVVSANMDPRMIMISKDKKMFGGMMNGGGSFADLQEYNPDKINQFGAEFDALTQKDLDKLRARKDIKNVEPIYQLQPKYLEFSMKTDKKYTGRVEVRDNTLTVATAAGRSLQKGSGLANDEATVPEGYLDTLDVKNRQEAIGKTLTITVMQTGAQNADQAAIMQAFQTGGEAAVRELVQPKEMQKTLKVVAVTKKTADQLTSPSFIYINGNTAKELSDFTTEGTDMHQKYLGASALVNGDSDPQAVKDALMKDKYNAATAEDMQGMLFTFVNILQGIVMGFGILALIVSVFGIVNTMYISVLERTQQIGLMKALGASRRDIGRLFRYEAAWVGLLGGVIGVIGAWVGATIFNPIISEKLSLGEHYLLIFQPLVAVGVILSLAAVAIVAGWLPSRRAANLDPIEALRTE